MKRRIRNTQARNTRSKTAKDVIIREIPAILKANPRARRGVEAAELIVNPPPFRSPSSQPPPSNPPPPDQSQNATPPSPPHISLHPTTSLHAAHRLLSSSPSRHRPRVAILNMASPLRPGGGVLTGAASQEEYLCARTTLYPSLRESFYRLPEVGGIYTPDVLVFRSWDDVGDALPKTEQFYVDVVSAGMLRFPDLEGVGEDGEERKWGERDREMAIDKMRGVMRILRMKGVDRVVLGAWGCGAYGNPVGEVARAWRRVLLGKGQGKGKGGVGKGSESWEELEVVFAIKDRRMARSFAEAFGEGMEVVGVDDDEEDGEGDGDEAEDVEHEWSEDAEGREGSGKER